MSWSKLESQAPEIAAFAKERMHNKVAYLATVRKDGAPRVHPFTPIIGEGHFFVFMEPTSPKGNDLRRDGRYAIHCAVTDSSGKSGEVILTGKAKFIEDPELRALAVKICLTNRIKCFDSCITSSFGVLLPAATAIGSHLEAVGMPRC